MSTIAITGAIVTAAGLAAKIPALLSKVKTTNLVEFTRATRVEPIVLVDDGLAYQPYTPDVMQMLCSMFSGYYLQAVALSVNVGKVETLKLLETLNPNRGGALAALAMESYEHQLPMIGQSLGLESFGMEDDSKGGGSTSGKDSLKASVESSNLSVGKMLEVHIDSEGQKATFPIQIRLMANLVKSSDLVHNLSGASKDRSFRGRWTSLRMGQITFWNDFVFANDLIDDYRKASVREAGSVFNILKRRQSVNRSSSLVSGTPSVADASNMLVISETTRKEFERASNMRLSSYRHRQNLFENTTMMIIVVVDTEWEQVTIYHRGLDGSSQMSVKEIKSSNKSAGPDITEILKAYRLGDAPGL